MPGDTVQENVFHCHTVDQLEVALVLVPATSYEHAMVLHFSCDETERKAFAETKEMSSFANLHYHLKTALNH